MMETSRRQFLALTAAVMAAPQVDFTTGYIVVDRVGVSREDTERLMKGRLTELWNEYRRESAFAPYLNVQDEINRRLGVTA